MTLELYAHLQWLLREGFPECLALLKKKTHEIKFLFIK